MKKILVMLTKTSSGNQENQDRLNRCQAGDVVIFTQDAVFSFSVSGTPIDQLIKEKLATGVRIYASANDCLARGMTPPEGIKQVDYSEQVDLITECELAF